MAKSSKQQNNRQEAREIVREKGKIAILYIVLRVIVVVIMIHSFIDREYENFFLCILTLILFMIPTLIERRLSIDIPDLLEAIILLFIFAAEILGEIRSYYIHYPYWDTILHTINGFLAAAIGFSLVDILNKEKRVAFQLSPLTMAIVAFSFSMTIGVIWEFFEFSMDTFFGLDMQKDTIVHSINSVMLSEGVTTIPSAIHDITDVIVVTADGTQYALGLGGYLDIGLIDTMEDLIVNFIGATVFSVLGYFFVKERGRGRISGKLKGLFPRNVSTMSTTEFLKKKKKNKTEE